jgi:hypothetical protein
VREEHERIQGRKEISSSPEKRETALEAVGAIIAFPDIRDALQLFRRDTVQLIHKSMRIHFIIIIIIICTSGIDYRWLWPGLKRRFYECILRALVSVSGSGSGSLVLHSSTYPNDVDQMR